MLKFVDLCCGIGGFHIGLERACISLGIKYQCVFAADKDKYARQTYKDFFNFNPHGDIECIKDFAIPEHSLLFAGFPCQPFSQAGQHYGLEDKRSSVIFKIFSIIDCHQPNVVVLENVKGLLTNNNGKDFEYVCKTLEELHYTVNWKILSGINYGVPQKRDRVFIVAWHKYEQFKFPEPQKLLRNVGSLLEPEDEVQDYMISEKGWEGIQRRFKKHKGKGRTFCRIYGPGDSYIHTLTATMSVDKSRFLIAGSPRPRALTPKECQRFMGFDSEYEFTVSKTQTYKQLGNAVIPNVVHSVMLEVFKQYPCFWRTDK